MKNNEKYMEKRTTRERFMPLGINLAVATIGLGVGSCLAKKADKLENENKNFLSEVVKGVSIALVFAGTTAATVGTLITGLGACTKYKYTDEEMNEILEGE